ncbi:MAG: hypothetical protein HY901_19385, partial [Deltaproteobacteria bacterium]|nr:hypothetical protein [Deltaproteobacteria bacterium]
DCPPAYPRHPFWMAIASPPVFQVADGDSIYLSGIAALSDGTVYFASGPGADAAYAGPFGLAVWKPGQAYLYLSPETDLGLPSRDIIDLQRLPDDTLLIALRGGGLWRWNPKPEPRGVNLGRVEGLPTNDVHRVYVDAMVSPAAVYVATRSGFALMRFEAKGLQP